jgi:two-component system, cell cycle response regulator CpdR
MGRGGVLEPIALVVEDDMLQRELLVALLEESIGIIQCESAEAALLVLEKADGCLAILITDVNLAGRMDGIELARFAKQRCPALHVVVTSGLAPTKVLPNGVMFLPKPWLPTDVLREVNLSLQ